MFSCRGLLVACLAAVAAAAPGSNDVLKDKDLKPYREEVAREFQLVREGKLPIADLIAQLGAKAAKEKAPVVASIRRYLLGSILMELPNRAKEAEDEFRKALELHARFPAVLGRLAMLANGTGEKARAKKLLRQALELDPVYTAALDYLAGIYAGERNFEEAIKYHKESLDIAPGALACTGLAGIYAELSHGAYSEKDKAAYAKQAVQYADMFLALAPEDGNSHLFRAKVLMDLDRREAAAKALEQICTSSLNDGFKVKALYQLYMLNAKSGRLKEAIASLERLLKHEIVKGKGREEIEKKVGDLNKYGYLAFTMWMIELELKTVENPGATAEDRRDAMRNLLGFLKDPNARKAKEFRPLVRDVFRAVIRVLRNAPPKLSLEVFDFFQQSFPDPQLLPILVHFIYPADDKQRTPAVRTVAVRTIATLGKNAALPTLYYCLRDEPGDVLREVTNKLGGVCDGGPRVGGDLEALTRKQVKYARTEWRKYFLGDEGSEKMRTALVELRKVVDMDPGFNRSVKTKPMADHVAWAIVLDDDMPYETWLEGYKFLRDYLAKDFRPVAQREMPVTKGERGAIVKAINEFFGGKDAGMPDVEGPEKNPK